MTITEEAIRFIWEQVDKLFVRKNDIQQEVNSSTNPVSSAAVKAIVDRLSGTPIVPKGSIEFSNLPTLTDASIGDLYNIKDNFTTTDDFIEGAGAKISAGTNVVCVEENLTKKWDCFGTNFEVDSEPVQNSNNPISSNAVYSLKKDVEKISGNALTDELKAQYDEAVQKSHVHNNKQILDSTEYALDAALYAKINSIENYLPKAGGTMTGTVNFLTDTAITSKSQSYKVFLRNDGTNFYILQSDANSEVWNTQVPFIIDLSKGEASINGGAAKLTTPRTIAGASFDGTANIDISYNNLIDKPTIPIVSNDLTSELKVKYDAAATNSHTHSNKDILDKTTAVFTEELKAKVETPYLPKAGGTMTGTILSQANNCLVSQFGDYKVFFRNNGTDRFYVLLSDKGGDTWNNDKHPFTINLETGEGYINGSAATLKDSGWIDMEINSDFITSGTIKYRTYGKQLMIYGENVVLAQELKISPSAPQMLASTTGIDFSNIKCCSGFGRTGGGHGAHIHALQYTDGTNMISAEAVATACPAGENLYFTITGLID